MYEILKKGSEKAKRKAEQTLASVKRAMRINYFEDAELIAAQAKQFQAKE